MICMTLFRVQIVNLQANKGCSLFLSHFLACTYVYMSKAQSQLLQRKEKKRRSRRKKERLRRLYYVVLFVTITIY
jgi:hypothetical protein